MNKVNLQTTDMVDENIKRIGELFPNCLTEVKDENGRPQVAINFDQLRQELSKDIVEGPVERYQFTWPDKRNAIRLANAPTTDTLRPVRNDETTPTGADSEGNPYCSTGSVNFDTTENLYIEGDNLQVLKLLREDYLGKIKMIYIDPPYNTGNDFVYNDDFSQKTGEYMHNSGQEDEEGNRLVANTESNGRFHTDWLNMIYPRLKVAKDLLSEDGVIFISIGDNECTNLGKVCNEVFGEKNFIAKLNIITGANQAGEGVLIQKNVEYCYVYAKNILKISINRIDQTESSLRNLNDAPTPLETRKDMGYTIYYNPRNNDMIPVFDYDKELIYTDDEKIIYKDRDDLLSAGYVPVRPGRRNGKLHRWRWGFDTFKDRIKEIVMVPNKGGYTPKFEQQGFNPPKNIQNFTVGTNDLKLIFGDSVPFEYSKGTSFMRYLVGIGSKSDSVILDFFSGSATTAHAVMQLNAEDGGKRKFIMVQLPEVTDVKSEAHKAGYKNICEIGKERIRRAGKKIKEEHPEAKDLDTGFRVLKLDTSNMQDVYYTPSEFNEQKLFDDNIKSDRTEEDLLFQTMIDLGIEQSAKIEKRSIAGKTVWSVSDGYLMACFGEEVNETTITEIARQQPYYFVMRDSSLANDQVADNFEQIFNHYSKDTIRRIL